ncbi:Metallo-hydrolase/oxidoreductase [Gloeophyllum trabeum ATCC 11539]|uniref:Metallo-hydrolase/oxidoreductase n=1 Tax=Gloeophyllum trabeum (strain ATCC 11539 / FP-39264 / Madison 617) TaxID=670483 RepID=S7Q8B2_GLOTA|nr:Metallo-hydrolase/oxidoreductase [Gloeophyllum trabeum ATCC 11539]EPQ56221.1 Metallo-hydrolase/oxidoreductase [Gloeophyllum trabeum ATCC 11539]
MSSALNIPPSDATVDIKILYAALIRISAFPFMHPVLPGHERFVAPAYVFYVEHPTTGKRVLFDLGVRKKPETSAPALWKGLQQVGVEVTVEKDVATQLTEGGVDLSSINAIIWSHSHFDHTGDPSTFPGTTELVLGPGTKEHFFPPYPENPEAVLLASDFEGRKITELSPEDFNLTIGGFKAHDYFDDGSFYLLDVPGHCPGHMAGLARVTPTTFVFMGGDTCHHPGQFRPNPFIQKHLPCPASLLANLSHEHFPKHIADRNTATPLLSIPPQPPTVYHDPPSAIKSIEKLQAFDGNPDVLVVLAHDASIERLLELFPFKANEWKAKGWKDASWDFLKKDNKAFRFSPA